MIHIRKRAGIPLLFFAAFMIWTMVVYFVDVQTIGPAGSSVGLAGINGFVHRATSVHFTLYAVTDWLSLVPVGVCAGFGMLGLSQWIGRRRLRRVDRSILVLGGFYLVTLAAYLLFERFVINYRPVMIGGVLEASYPSSTTVLVLCVMSTARRQWNARVKNRTLRKGLSFAALVFSGFMVAGRLLSGVHWLSDIVGGMLLSACLVTAYDAVSHPD